DELGRLLPAVDSGQYLGYGGYERAAELLLARVRAQRPEAIPASETWVPFPWEDYRDPVTARYRSTLTRVDHHERMRRTRRIERLLQGTGTSSLTALYTDPAGRYVAEIRICGRPILIAEWPTDHSPRPSLSARAVITS